MSRQVAATNIYRYIHDRAGGMVGGEGSREMGGDPTASVNCKSVFRRSPAINRMETGKHDLPSDT